MDRSPGKTTTEAYEEKCCAIPKQMMQTSRTPGTLECCNWPKKKLIVGTRTSSHHLTDRDTHYERSFVTSSFLERGEPVAENVEWGRNNQIIMYVQVCEGISISGILCAPSLWALRYRLEATWMLYEPLHSYIYDMCVCSLSANDWHKCWRATINRLMRRK